MSVSVEKTKPFTSFCEAPNRNISWNEWCSPEFEAKVKSLVDQYISSPEINTNVATPFLAALVFVNNKYLEFRGVTPFSAEIQKVNEKLINNKENGTKPIITTHLEKDSKPAKTATGVKALASQLEPPKAPTREPQIAPSGKKVTMATSSPQAKISSIKNRIASLDLDNKNLNAEIKLITEDLDQLKKGDLISEQSYEGLIKALEHIKVGYSFDKADAFLTSLASFLKIKFPKDRSKRIDVDEYENMKKMENRNARSNLLKALKKMATSADFLTETSATSLAINQLSTFQKETMTKFYSSLALCYKKQFALFHTKLTSNFHRICKTFSNIDQVVGEQLKKEFADKAKVLDSSSNQLFSKLVGHYSYQNCIGDALHPIFVKKYCNTFLSNFLLENDQIKSPEKEVSKSFNDYYNRFFASRHQWLAQNAHHIVKPYNQGDDPDTGDGMCFNNCLDRFAIFLATPTIDPKDIPMQSSREGRFAQTRTRIGSHGIQQEATKIFHEITDVEQKEMLILNVRTQVTSLELASLNRLNLEQVNKPIEITGDTTVEATGSLLIAIRGLHNQSNQPTQFMIGLYGGSGAHAINVQFDKKRKVYRFIDDNLGICEYPDAASFARGLNSYLNIFYPDMKKFTIDFFEEKKPK